MQMGTIITLWESRTRAKNSEKSNLELNYGLSFWTKWTQSERVRCIAVVYTRKCMCSLFACCHHVYSLFPIAKRRTENEFTATEHTNDFRFCIVWSPYKRWSTRNERDFFDFWCRHMFQMWRIKSHKTVHWFPNAVHEIEVSELEMHIDVVGTLICKSTHEYLSFAGCNVRDKIIKWNVDHQWDTRCHRLSMISKCREILQRILILNCYRKWIYSAEVLAD